MISFFTKLKENEASELPVGVAGFCWGGESTGSEAHAADLTQASGAYTWRRMKSNVEKSR